MTHKELWLEIAEAFGTPRGKRTKRQYYLTGEGLCAAVKYLTRVWPNGFALAFTPPDLLATHDVWWPEHGWSPLWKPSHDAQRCLFACFMAAMSEDDYNEMVEAV